MVTIKRTWLKQSQVSDYNDTIDIWDSGSHIYERWPDGTEYYWKVLSRELTTTGFTEVLQKMRPWDVPGQVLHQEQVPLLIQSLSEYQVGGWMIEQSSFCIDNSLEEKPNRIRKIRQVDNEIPYLQKKQYSSRYRQERVGPSQPQRKPRLPYRVQRIEP